MVVILNTGHEPPEYFETVGKFLENISDRNVRSIALVALCDDGHDVAWHQADCLDVKRMAGILDLAAVRQMLAEEEDEAYE